VNSPNIFATKITGVCLRATQLAGTEVDDLAARGVHHEMFVETMFDYHKQREHNTRAFSLETHIINTYQKPVGF
jgi:hypothetical protein